VGAVFCLGVDSDNTIKILLRHMVYAYAGYSFFRDRRVKTFSIHRAAAEAYIQRVFTFF
jgi:dienelactone hydrolase